LIERKTSITISRKTRGPRKPQALREAKQRKAAVDTAVQPRQKPGMGGRPGCTVVSGGAWSAVHPGTAVPAAPAPRGLQFSAIYLFSLFDLGGLLELCLAALYEENKV